MSTPRIDEAGEIVAELKAAGIVATIDPQEADTNRPCVLVPPPTIDWTAGTMAGPAKAWRLIALASGGTGTLLSWQELDELLSQIEPVAHVETAEPIGYVLTPATGPVPAYAIRITT